MYSNLSEVSESDLIYDNTLFSQLDDKNLLPPNTNSNANANSDMYQNIGAANLPTFEPQRPKIDHESSVNSSNDSKNTTVTPTSNHNNNNNNNNNSINININTSTGNDEYANVVVDFPTNTDSEYVNVPPTVISPTSALSAAPIKAPLANRRKSSSLSNRSQPISFDQKSINGATAAASTTPSSPQYDSVSITSQSSTGSRFGGSKIDKRSERINQRKEKMEQRQQVEDQRQLEKLLHTHQQQQILLQQKQKKEENDLIERLSFSSSKEVTAALSKLKSEPTTMSSISSPGVETENDFDLSNFTVEEKEEGAVPESKI
eukprot:Awhi_evm1s13891